MTDLNRRTFLQSSTVASAAALGASVGVERVANAAEAADTSAKASSLKPVRGYDYRLPKIEAGSTLLFQGDSITDMKWGRNQKDRNHYLGHSYVYLIASRLHTDMPEAKLNFLNRGISGNTVPNLQARWQKDAIDLKPDVLSILIGVNDVGRAIRAKKKVDVTAYEKGYRDLLTQSRAANPRLKLVLLEPFILKGRESAWQEQVDMLRPVVAKLAEAFDAVLIRTQDVFNAALKRADASHWIWDGVHPLPQGHELIARQWIWETANAWG